MPNLILTRRERRALLLAQSTCGHKGKSVKCDAPSSDHRQPGRMPGIGGNLIDSGAYAFPIEVWLRLRYFSSPNGPWAADCFTAGKNTAALLSDGGGAERFGPPAKASCPLMT